jgi:hypothetical protein
MDLPTETKPAKTAKETNKGKLEPSPAETLLFFNVIKHMNGKPDVNWDAVAADGKLKNAEVAKVRFSTPAKAVRPRIPTAHLVASAGNLE